MFYYLNGTITILDTNLAVVDCGGVGYACHTTNYTISRLQVGRQARLYTYCNIKEDAFDIFGFYTREELDCFEKLLSVGGVGPKAALAILSVVTPDQFTLAVMTQDVKTLTMAQGVGKKLAERIMLELKGKFADGGKRFADGSCLARARQQDRRSDGGAQQPRLQPAGDCRSAQGRGRQRHDGRGYGPPRAQSHGHAVRGDRHES